MFRQKKEVTATLRSKPAFASRWFLIAASYAVLVGLPQMAFGSASETQTTGSIETTAELPESSELNDWSGTFKHETLVKDRGCCLVCDALMAHLTGQTDHGDCSLQ